MGSASDAEERGRAGDESGAESDAQASHSRPYEALFELDGRGRTPLFLAAERGLLKEVEEMIFGLAGTGLSPMRLALIATKDHAGLTAADLAEQNGHTEIVKLLRSEKGRMEYFG